MDIRHLKYFIAVAEEANITHAAERLHISQPGLSAQLAALEEELGHRLIERGARGIALTEKGLLLKRRAEDLVNLAERVAAEVKGSDSGDLAGTIAIGAGETPAFAIVAKAASILREAHPGVDFAITSGNGEDLLGRLKEGTLDFAVLIGPGRYDGLDYFTLPHMHRWGLLTAKDSPLAKKKLISPSDARSVPLIVSRQSMVAEFLAGWLGVSLATCNVVATYNLLYNAAALVTSGLGSAICLDDVTPQVFSSDLVFRPFGPDLTSDVYLAWRKNAPLPPAASALIDIIKSTSSNVSESFA